MLRKVKLYGELAEFVGHKELDAVVNSTADAIRFLITNFPKLEAHMGQRYYKVLVDDYEIGEKDIHNPTGKFDINIVPVITGASGNLGKILLGAVLIGSAFLTGGVTGAAFFKGATVQGSFAAAGFATKAAITIGGALVLQGVTDMLFPVDDSIDEEDPRISFSFSGVQNTSRAGTSHPIVYGEIVTGSVVISAGIDTHQVSA
jgi:predicted phage tail protein